MKNLMKLTLSFAVLLSLPGCSKDVIDAPEKKTATIFYPELSAKTAFDTLQTDASALAINKDNAELLAKNFFARIMNVLEIASQQVDKVADSNYQPIPVFKPGARSLEILDASKKYCKNTSDDSTALEAEALIWDDVNEDKHPLVGDKWYYILSHCVNSSTSANVSGVIEMFGMEDPFLQHPDMHASQPEKIEFSDYHYKLDMQLDYPNNSSVFYQNMSMTLSRSVLEDEAEETTLIVKSDSKLGVRASLDNQLYLLHVNSLQAIENDTAQNLKLSVDAKYYLSQGEDKKFIQVTTPEALVFDFEFLQSEDASQNGKITKAKLSDGSLKLVGADNSSLVLSVVDSVVNEGEKELKILVDSDGDGKDDHNFNSDPAEIFDETNSKFYLLNITGG